MDLAALQQQAFDLLVKHGPGIIYAVVTLIVGLWIAGGVAGILKKSMNRAKVDESLQPFLTSIIRVALKIVVVISAASMVGIETTSFVAIVGAAGLAVGLALQGSLSNFAGGVIILIFKPFKVDDVIEAQGHIGKVKEIQIFNTLLVTPDNRLIIIPNGALSNGNIKNLTAFDTLRVDMMFGISYSDDIGKAKEIIKNYLDNHPLVLKDPEPAIIVASLGDNSVNLAARPWAKTEDYWTVLGETTEAIKLLFDEKGVSFPFPQRDVHLYTMNSES